MVATLYRPYVALRYALLSTPNFYLPDFFEENLKVASSRVTERLDSLK